MKAKVIAGYTQERRELNKLLPLDTPMSITLSVAQICNFKCFFCTHSLDKEKVKEIGFSYKNMDISEFMQFANQLKEFSSPIKLAVFSGMGEPLLNKYLPQMIQYLKQNHLAERVEIYSNGSLLSTEWVHELVNAGLDRFRLSIEGLTEERYREVCKYDLDIKKLLKNIEYFYQNRGQCKIYIKTIDTCLKEGEEQKFYQMFGNICDEIFIEHLSNCQPMVDTDQRWIGEKTRYNEEIKEYDICPYLFYTLYLDADCNVFPCVIPALPVQFAVGNTKEKSLKEIWNGETLRNIRIQHLLRKRTSIEVCKKCQGIHCMYHKEDSLDNYADMLLQKFQQ